AADDSGGDPLGDTAAGRFARLAAEAALGGLAPVALLALLKHPLLRLGAKPRAHDYATQALERAVLRGPRPRPGSAGLARALKSLRLQLDMLRRGEASELHRTDPRSILAQGELTAAVDLVQRLAAALSPLESGSRTTTFAQLAARHRAVLEALSADESNEVAVFA